ncbi:hypothetical protein WD019_13570 [Fictibacillus sp. Mic-4]|uniref:hypothetical protein n=1 Tax=Fictibacillus sp. Mic-4 TaxID=3132826 RepID=UPI003CFB3915
MFCYEMVSFIIGFYLLGSGFYMILKDKDQENFKGFIAGFIDLISDSITSEGLRFLFGGVFLGIGLLLMFL